jgi:hypothetical protein
VKIGELETLRRALSLLNGIIDSLDRLPNEGPGKAMCQRCHNRYDSPMRMEHAAETRQKKR